MEKRSSYVAFFDLDKTLLTVNSGRILVLMAYKRGLMTTRTLLKAIYTSIIYKLNLRNTVDIVEDMPKWLCGLSLEAIINLSNHVVEEKLIISLRESVLQEIEFHRKKDADIVLLSAALPYICMPIAKHLGIEHVICSEMEINDGEFTGKPIGKICLGPEKEIRAQEYCKENSYSLSEAYCYGDSEADQFILEAVGHPVCVNPDSKLKKAAILNNWKIIN